MCDSDKTNYDPGATQADGSTTILDGAKLSVSADPSYEQGDAILGTYRVESKAIESGGMGRVWRVHHTGWNVDLAMKRPRAEHFADEKSKLDFIRECDTWIKLGLHPNIVSCYYVRLIDGIPTIFSEWMDGGDLAHAIDGGGLYEYLEDDPSRVQERILDIAIQFARGLHYAHEARDENGKPKQIVHQDVKPGNVLLTKDGEAKVGDFGLARARAAMTQGKPDKSSSAEGDSTRSILSPSGGCTPAYCSPEQSEHRNVLTPQTDVYSWAVSVLEMYKGDHPWANGVVAGLDCRRYFDQAKVPVPAPMKDLLERCLACEPEDRPQGFGLILAELLAIYRLETGKVYPREDSKAAADTADSLNNRALSMLDLGKPEEAERLWDRALKLSPRHSESLYNANLHRWRIGSISDAQALFAVNTAEDPKWYREQLLLESCAPSAEQVLVRFSSSARQAAISDDQRLLVDSAGRIFSFTTGEKLCEIRYDDFDHGRTADSLNRNDWFRLSADGTVLFLGNCGETNWAHERFVISFDTAAGRLIKILVRQNALIESMFFDRYRNAVIGVCSDRIIYIWDAATGECKRQSPISRDIPDYAHYVALSPDGKWILCYSVDRILRLDVDTGRIIQTLKEDHPISALGLTRDGGRIVSASENRIKKKYPIKIWNIETGNGNLLFDHGDTALSVCFSPDEKRVVTSSLSNIIRFWEAQNGRCMRTTAGLMPQFSPDGKWLLNRSGSSAYEVQKTPDFGYRAVYMLCRVSKTSEAVDDQSQSNRLAAQYLDSIHKKDMKAALEILKAYRKLPQFDGDFSYWKLKAAAEPYCIHIPPVTVLKTSADNPIAHFDAARAEPDPHVFGQFTLKKNKSGEICVLNRETQATVCQFNCRSCKLENISFCPDGKWLLLSEVHKTDTDSTCLWLVNAKTGERQYLYDEPGFSVYSAKFSPDGTKILCLLKNSKVVRQYILVLLDTISGNPVIRIALDHGINYIFTPDGKYCVLRSYPTLAIFDLCNAKNVMQDQLPSDCFGSVFVLNSNGTAAAFNSGDGHRKDITYCQLDWELSFPGWADWDEGARPYLEAFLALHPNWNQSDFDVLISRLQDCGFGWLRPEGIRKNLLQMSGMSESAPR